MASTTIAFLVGLCVILCVLEQATRVEAWSGNSCSRRVRAWVPRRYCACWYRWWGCSYWRTWWRRQWVTRQYCCPGWRHNGNRNCNIPICFPTCKNGGTCSAPNTCDCTAAFSGPTCTTPECSYQFPCYPGDCLDSPSAGCNCSVGFTGPVDYDDRCLTFDENVEEMRPEIGLSTVTLSFILKAENQTKFEFIMDATQSNQTDVLWSNQRLYNDLFFEFTSMYDIPEDPERAIYIHNAEWGIVGGTIDASITTLLPDASGTYEAWGKSYVCESNEEPSSTNPIPELTCRIHEERFKTLIEHGDRMRITFNADNGGYRTVLDPRAAGGVRTDSFIGLKESKSVDFLFDFIAPRHCEEKKDNPNRPQFQDCTEGSQPLQMTEEITKDPIEATWDGWTDELSTIQQYFLEVFELEPDEFGRLTEKDPLRPNHTKLVTAMEPHVMSFTPAASGMYSCLIETSDRANNSKIARRLVLYDPDSQISLKEGSESKLYVESASEPTNFQWQTTAGASKEVEVSWSNHFVNEMHENGMYLNEVLPYPIQFDEIEEDGILMTEKFVFFDDEEGERSLAPINNFHGIVKFEVNQVFSDDEEEPTTGWETVTPLAERFVFPAAVGDGDEVRIWVRATDAMDNVKVDQTVVFFDSSPPVVSPENNSDTTFTTNLANGPFDFSTRINFIGRDIHSGVHRIDYKLTMEMEDGEPIATYEGTQDANIDQNYQSPRCERVLDTCFYLEQQVDLNNCWFIVDKEELKTAAATVELTVYNQAMLNDTLTFKVPKVTDLNGLEEFSTPTNLKVVQEKSHPNTLTLSWDLPEASCYGRTDLLFTLIGSYPNSTQIIRVDKDKTSVIVGGLIPASDYNISLGMTMGDRVLGVVGAQVATPAERKLEAEGIPTGAIVGAVIAAVVVIALLVAILVVLFRRGKMEPVRKRFHEMSVKYRNRHSKHVGLEGVDNRSYDNHRPTTVFADDIYLAGGIDFEEVQSWHLSRSDVIFETLIKSGHFANIYKAALKKGGRSRETVVAKTLKESHKDEDEVLMKQKMHFSGTLVGNHPNVIRFIGGVMDDPGLGPFIIYEYCENGTLRDYLVNHKTNVTIEMQENLYRFGLAVAKGMDYLVERDIVHRRLAARNILLTFVNEVKIAGFGPQPKDQEGDGGDAEAGAKERIPIKWMAPECMQSTRDATEQTDVWSYGVVLWEIFTLGDQPYPNIRSRDLPALLKKGQRLPKPEQCDDTWYGVMQRTWALKPEKRPTFKQIREELDSMFVQSPGDENYYYSQQ